jgi:hypothetical protein
MTGERVKRQKRSVNHYLAFTVILKPRDERNCNITTATFPQ